MNKYLDIYVSFLKIGSFTIGGGYVMVPLIQELAVENRKWCTEDEMIEYITVAQSLPGMFGANVATNIGLKIGGKLGAFLAVAGMVTPSLIIITLFASVYDVIMEYVIVQNIFKGIKSAVLALIVLTTINLFKKTVKNAFQLCVFIVAMAMTLFFGISPFYLILGGLILGPLYSLIINRKRF